MPNMIDEQKALLEELRARDPELSVDWDEARGVAARIRGALPARLGDPQVPAAAAPELLERYGPLFGPVELARNLRFLRATRDDLGWTHAQYQQVVPGSGAVTHQETPLDVYGARLVLHADDQGRLVEVQSSCWRGPEVPRQVRFGVKELRARLEEALEGQPGYRQLRDQIRRREEKQFPVMQEPRLVVYPWKGAFHLAWTTYAYAPHTDEEERQGLRGGPQIALGQLVVDAGSGEQLLFAPTRKYAENPDTGAGLGGTPLGGPFTSHPLRIVRVDATGTYRLRDTTHAREIITYDAAGNSSWVYPGLAGQLAGGTVPVSEDTDGDKNWNRTAANTTDAERTASQQPEVDAHRLLRQLYEWYDALAGGRAGWDNNQYSPSLVQNPPLRVVAHTYDADAGTSRSVNAFFDQHLVGGRWVPYLAFFDGDPTATCSSPNDRAYDYLAGSPFIVGHEYGHAITDYNFEDGAGNPGLTYSGWLSAVHEGMSDVLGGLFSEQWRTGLDISSAGLIFRNLAFPRDPGAWVNRSGSFPCGLGNHNKDHFADRNLNSGFRYDRGTILAHTAYLMAAGGVHQRSARTPALIPVGNLGRQVLGGLDFPRAARIWYRAHTYYFSTHGALTGLPTNDENTFRTLRGGCVSAAIDLYGSGSPEHRTTVLAFYASGLHPAGTTYGADVAFMPWGAAWWQSRPYVGLGSPDWSSVDLFINNGGSSEWNAVINVNGPGGTPTQFENDVYCRVRNLGDQAATDVQVRFYYVKAGMGTVSWFPVTDKNGAVQVLNLGTLGAGQLSFPDSAQNSPPTSARVKWYLPPLGALETVNHFCLKAVVTASNDVNPHNNEVQSNVAYVAYTPAAGLRFAFVVGNPFEKTLVMQLGVHSRLPKGWEVRVEGANDRLRLQPREERTLSLTLEMPEGAETRLEPPFDGDIQGELRGRLTGHFRGTLTDITWEGERLQGHLAADLADVGLLTGRFTGTLDPQSGEVRGKVRGLLPRCPGPGDDLICVGVRGCLRPWRRVDLSQIVNGQAINGVTVQVQVPPPPGACRLELPPTDPFEPVRT